MDRVFRPIVRLANVDVDGSLPLVYGLSEVKGVGFNFALGVVRVLGLNPYMRIGFLTEEEVKKVEAVIMAPEKFGIPQWAFNRRKDYSSGRDMHLVGNELIFYAKEDIEREKRIKSWRGIRHSMGMKVRGQRTRTTGRTGVTVGVRKRRQVQQQQKKEEK
ncbi:30S ribosomal protein S13 [Thermogladius sp. 4427co]|uniref:30S ribosomal protein S13 n=1 Tax=Thermogladius sp. 4427co TaxID=3450718 RepID=UPI003F793416